LAIAFITLGATYKWVDKDGRVHYSDQPPDDYKTNEVDIEPGPSQEDVEEAQEIVEKWHQWHRNQKRYKQSIAPSLTLTELGPLPKNESSEYVETEATGIYFNTEKLIAQFTLTLKAKKLLPFGAFFEVHFPNPEDPNNPFVVGKVREGGASEIFISSPDLKGLKCWNYEIVTYIYRGSSKSVLLGSHSQRVQSHINMNKVRNGVELVTALAEGNCP
jgi:hypothetical protein